MTWLLWIAGAALMFVGGNALLISGVASGRSRYVGVALNFGVMGWSLIVLGALLWWGA